MSTQKLKEKSNNIYLKWLIKRFHLQILQNTSIIALMNQPVDNIIIIRFKTTIITRNLEQQRAKRIALF